MYLFLLSYLLIYINDFVISKNHNIETRFKRAHYRDTVGEILRANGNGIQIADPRCNSERLRDIIKSANGRDTTALKRNIQTLAEQKLRLRFNVICAEDDFSYITNTEEYCQETLPGGKTCYVFRQLSRFATTQERNRERKHLVHRH